MQSRHMKIVIALASLGLLVACGDNDHEHHVDAANPDGAVDAPIDAFVECNYTEAHDTTNDYLAVPGAVEESSITFKANSTRTICGTINNGHFDTNFFSIDIDNYGLTVAQDSDVVVRLTGMAQNISQVGVFVADDADNGLGGNFYLGNHAVFSTHLAAGHYKFSVEAYDNQDATMSVPYEMRITMDDPVMRCPRVTATADYTESADGVNNNANDIVAIDYANSPQRELTGINDDPENTMLTIASTQKYRFTGTSASTPTNGSYFDRDTYLFTAGPTTNEMAIRLNWPGSTADLDFYVFQEGTVVTPITNASKTKLGEDEFATFAVTPGSKYWLWVGAFNGNTTGLPVTYDATICPTAFP